MKEYYYLKDSTPVGPFSLDELHALHLEEKIALDTMVSKEGAAEWLPYSALLPKDAEAKLPPVPSAPVKAEPVEPFAVAKEGCPYCQADLPITQKREVPFVCPTCFGDIHSKEKSMWDQFCYAFGQYATFKGRATRAEFWSYMLFVMIFSFVIAGMGVIIPFISIIFELVVFIPSLAILFRRFHDVNLSGWWVILLKGLPIVTTSIASMVMIMAILNAADGADKLIEKIARESEASTQGSTVSAEALYELNGEALMEILLQAWRECWHIVVICGFVIPFVCLVVGIIICVMDSKRGVNKYGVSTKYPIA